MLIQAHMSYRKFYSLIFFLALGVFVFPARAQAYLDAGTANYLIQLVIAFVAGGLFTAKTFWRQLRSVLSRGRKRQPTAAPSRDEESEISPSDQV